MKASIQSQSNHRATYLKSLETSPTLTDSPSHLTSPLVDVGLQQHLCNWQGRRRKLLSVNPWGTVHHPYLEALPPWLDHCMNYPHSYLQLWKGIMAQLLARMVPARVGSSHVCLFTVFRPFLGCSFMCPSHICCLAMEACKRKWW